MDTSAPSTIDIIELLMRGAGAGIGLLLATMLIAVARKNPRTSLLLYLGALCAGTNAIYILTSARPFFAVAGVLQPVFIAGAIANSVTFWWFATALFDDGFKWRWWRMAPLVLLFVTEIPEELFGRDTLGATLIDISQQVLVFAMLGHAIFLAVRDFKTDLVEPRRRFRIAFVLAAASLGIIITVVEVAKIFVEGFSDLLPLHAFAMLAINFAAALWFTSVRHPVFDPAVAGKSVGARDAQIRPENHAAYERLIALMDDGVYRTEKLTVAALAEQVGLAEHQLRKLINQELGYRNFAAFLNARRVEEAKAILADPARAREQVLQIALHLGFGSPAPFNRAFKEQTGQTPTTYRKAALGNGEGRASDARA
ncbi:MAG: helix-turn-helix transcriptional regulator [Pseudomonadota bacterium]